jgi:hypothetical protein
MAKPRATSPPESAATDSLAALRQRLVSLVRGGLGEIAISHEPPRERVAAERCVGLYCFELAPATTPARQPLSLQFNARFLITSVGADAATAADDLAALAFAALEEPGLEVDLEPLPMQAWTAFGLPPRPSFTITAPVRQTRLSRPARPVREAVLRLQPATAPLHGVLLAHDETPIADARIDLPALGRSTRTAADGTFAFGSLPDGSTLRLLATARGRSAEFQAQAGGGASACISLHLDLSDS